MKKDQPSNENFLYHGITSRILFWTILGMCLLGAIYMTEYYDIYERLLHTKNDHYMLNLTKRVVQEKELSASEFLKHVHASLESFQYKDVFEQIDRMLDHDPTLKDAFLIDTNGYIHYQTQTTNHPSSTNKTGEDIASLSSGLIQSNVYLINDQTFMECLIPITVQSDIWGMLKLIFTLDPIDRERQRLIEQKHFLIFSNLIWIFGVWISGIFSLGIILFIILSRHSKRLLQMGKDINGLDVNQPNIFKTLASRPDETGYLASQIQQSLTRMIHKFDTSQCQYDQLHETYEDSSQLNEKTRILLQEVQSGLKEWENQYRSTINACQEALMFLGRKDEIIEVNQAFLNMTGYHMGELQNTELIDLIPKAWKTAFTQILMRHVHNNIEPPPVEIAIRRKDQTFLYLFISGQLCFKQNNEFHKIILSGINISANKRTQYMLDDLERLLQTDLKEAIGRIIGLSELMSAKTQVGKKELLEWSGIIHQNARRMLDKVQQSFDFFKIEANEFELQYRVCNLIQMFQKLETDFSSLLLAKSINIKYSVDGHPMNWTQVLDIWGDCNLLYAMFTRLLGDIFDVSPDDQTITISCVQTKDLQVNIHCNVDFPEQDYNTFFNRPLDASDKRKGAYAALLIAKAHGGTIGLRSSTDKGTQLILILPGKTLTRQEITSSPLKILVADDSPNNRLLLDFYLSEGTKWSNDMANNGQEAVTLFSQNDYDMILMDIEMPVMDGISAIKAIRGIERTHKEKQRTCIIALTADLSPDINEQAFQAGADAFLGKPVEQEKLVETILTFKNKCQ
ncbi:MAG: response regulator [Candidatus Magnetomorum sp.]|nr:response regulator [Candidatus Magnetomorum sp.]